MQLGWVNSIDQIRDAVSRVEGKVLLEFLDPGDKYTAKVLGQLKDKDKMQEVGYVSSVFEGIPPSTLHTYFTPTVRFLYCANQGGEESSIIERSHEILGIATNLAAVVIVYRSDSAVLIRCIKCLRQQSVPAESILIVDNSEKAELRTTDFGDVEVMHPSENIGFAAGNNLGIADTDSEFIALLNPDAFPELGWLENLLNTAKENPQCAAFGTVQLLDENPEFLDGIGDSYHPTGVFRREGHGRRRADYSELRPREIFSPCAAAALYRREALEAVGGFDEDFFCYGEDVDLGFRLRLAGWKAMLVPYAIVRGYNFTVIPITWRNRRHGVAKLKIKEMGSRYLFIVLYVWLEKYFSRGDYCRRSSRVESVQAL